MRGIAVGLLVLIAIWLLMLAATPAQAAEGAEPVTAQESPYEAPELIQVDLPSWAAPLEPLAVLPLWAQAAVASAFVGGLFYLIPAIFRWFGDRFEAEGLD